MSSGYFDYKINNMTREPVRNQPDDEEIVFIENDDGDEESIQDSEDKQLNVVNEEASELEHIYLECEVSSCDEDIDLNTGEKLTLNYHETDSPRSCTMSMDTNQEPFLLITNNPNKHPQTLLCEICDLPFRTEELITSHFQTHDIKRTQQCEVCSNVVHKKTYKIHLELHKEAYEHRINTFYKKVKCDICSKKVSKNYIKFHMTKHGSEIERKDCEFCNKTISVNYYNDHVKRKHMNEKKRLSTKQQCPICEKKIRADIYKSHIASHSGQLKKYVCDQCGKEFKYSSVFKTHILTHTSELKYKCQFCDYRGLHLALLKIHVRTHTKDYAYKCITCNLKFISKSNLSAHERRHRPPEYICWECNKGFYAQRNLDKHYNLKHLGIRDFKCNLCEKAFGDKHTLLAHQKNIHNVKTKQCGRIGRLPSYLRQQNESQDE